MPSDSFPAPISQTVDRVISVVFACVALGVFATTFNDNWFSIADPDEAETVLVPRIILLCITALSLLLLLRSFLNVARSPVTERVNWRDAQSWGTLAAAVAVVIAVALAMGSMGFLPTMFLGILAMGWIMGYRGWVSLLAVAVLSPAIAWYLIVQVAELTLPSGPLLDVIGGR